MLKLVVDVPWYISNITPKMKLDERPLMNCLNEDREHVSLGTILPQISLLQFSSIFTYMSHM